MPLSSPAHGCQALGVILICSLVSGGLPGIARAAAPCPEKDEGQIAPLLGRVPILPLSEKEIDRSQAEGLACMGALIFYTWTRLLSTVVPEYSVRLDGGAPQHGLSWELAYELRPGGWRHGIYGSVAYYPRDDHVISRAGYRLRLFSLDLSVKRWGVHGYLEAGGFYGDSNGGTHLAARLRLGWLEPAGGGLFLGTAWELGLDPVQQYGELSAGMEFHW